MPVSSTHPEYDAHIMRWALVRDVVNSRVKQYIKDVDINDPFRNKRYKDDAQFTNFTGRTKHGLLGAIFRKNVSSVLPLPIAYLEEDATGTGMSLTKLAQEVSGEILQSARYGLLVDYPASQNGLTAAEVADMNLAARISRYTAESIINWYIEIVNGIPTLTLVVLKECTSVLGEDGFEWREQTQYRVLRMIEGTYVQLLYNEREELINMYEPLQSNGQKWDKIPFVFVGAEDNDASIDAAPLYDLAMLNIGHLRNSADYEESTHITGQPTLIINTSMSTEEFNAANPNGVVIGARRGHNLGESGSAQFLQASPNQLADTAMSRKEQQAIMLGARLITPTSANETVDAARMRHSGETSVLEVIAHNVEHALIKCCEYALAFMGDSSQAEEIDITVNTEFFDSPLDPNLVMAQLQLYNNGIIAKSDIRDELRRHGALDESRTDEDIDAEVDTDTGSDPGFSFLPNPEPQVPNGGSQ